MIGTGHPMPGDKDKKKLEKLPKCMFEVRGATLAPKIHDECFVHCFAFSGCFTQFWRDVLLSNLLPPRDGRAATGARLWLLWPGAVPLAPAAAELRGRVQGQAGPTAPG